MAVISPYIQLKQLHTMGNRPREQIIATERERVKFLQETKSAWTKSRQN